MLRIQRSLPNSLHRFPACNGRGQNPTLKCGCAQWFPSRVQCEKEEEKEKRGFTTEKPSRPSLSQVIEITFTWSHMYKSHRQDGPLTGQKWYSTTGVFLLPNDEKISNKSWETCRTLYRHSTKYLNSVHQNHSPKTKSEKLFQPKKLWQLSVMTYFAWDPGTEMDSR